MLTAGTQFEVELKKLIVAEKARLDEALHNRQTIQSYHDYLWIVGQIEALARVEDTLCAEAQTIVDKR